MSWLYSLLGLASFARPVEPIVAAPPPRPRCAHQDALDEYHEALSEFNRLDALRNEALRRKCWAENDLQRVIQKERRP